MTIKMFATILSVWKIVTNCICALRHVDQNNLRVNVRSSIPHILIIAAVFVAISASQQVLW